MPWHEDSFLEGLNENIVVTNEGAKLVIAGDSDGFYFSHLVLYANSGMTKGYVRLDDPEGADGVIGGGKYSEIWCSLEPVGD